MPNHDMVVIGASAGGVEALQLLTKALPADFPAAVFIVLHMGPATGTLLEKILRRHSSMPVESAADHKPILPGRIYVAVPDHHLLINDSKMRLVRGPRENRHRPAIDVLFRSAALAFGPRVIGVVLTGNLDDGTVGLWYVKHRGGIAIVQDPQDARMPSMPQNALANVDVDFTLPLVEIAPRLAQLVQTPAPSSEKYPPSEVMKTEEEIARMQDDLESIKRLGKPSAFTCPECQGTLYEIQDGRLVRYRCRTGHAYSIATLIAEQQMGAEEALWAAMRALREKAEMLFQQARREQGQQQKRLEAQARQVDKQAEIIRQIIEQAQGEHDQGKS